MTSARENLAIIEEPESLGNGQAIEVGTALLFQQPVGRDE